MNRYPLWKYLLILFVLVVGVIYALPNLYPSEPAVQVSSKFEQFPVNEKLLTDINTLLEEKGLEVKSSAMEGTQAMIRFHDTEVQLEAADAIKNKYERDYVVALNLAPATPGWLRSLSAQPMYLGLDLRGGVHFLMEVDMVAAVDKAFNRYEDEFRNLLRENKLQYLGVVRQGETLTVKFKDEATRTASETALRKEYRNMLLFTSQENGTTFELKANISPTQLESIQKFALEQNITTLRKRVNELGVAEPIIQQQGGSRIVVQLPGVQDTARAKEILGATATLEFRMVDEENDPFTAERSKRIPSGSKLFKERNGSPILLKRQIMLTGDYITGANAGFDQNNQPSVSINLDGKGGSRFADVTGKNVQKLMAVVFIETKYEEQETNGKVTHKKTTTQEVINVARIQEQLHSRFQITGLDSPAEARDLALLLRAGALAAPVYIVEERTIGPNLGQENIDSGMQSIIIGFVLVLIFMAVYYRVFGLVANVVLAMNVVLIFAVLSMLQATLTLPGIAGIVLTIGMAVDANVLIFERIKEELANGMKPQMAIKQGYEQAVSTIADANITTLIAAVVLFGFGTGPIKGFAITLAIGIASSMFTAIMGSRALINLIYGNKNVKSLSI